MAEETLGDQAAQGQCGCDVDGPKTAAGHRPTGGRSASEGGHRLLRTRDLFLAGFDF